MTLNVMAAQTFLFFTAGFETSSTALGYLMFELASNKSIQDKVRAEINSAIENNPEGLTHEVFKEMPYVDMVIAGMFLHPYKHYEIHFLRKYSIFEYFLFVEILRKYPPGSFLARRCTQAYKIPDTTIVVPEGTTIVIPVYGIHSDPKYYEKPDEFYPEHFTEQAKASRPHYTYMPFGDGPRICIGKNSAFIYTECFIRFVLPSMQEVGSPSLAQVCMFAHFLNCRGKIM